MGKTHVSVGRHICVLGNLILTEGIHNSKIGRKRKTGRWEAFVVFIRAAGDSARFVCDTIRWETYVCGETYVCVGNHMFAEKHL